MMKSRFCIDLPSFCLPLFSVCSYRGEKELKSNKRRVVYSSYSMDELAVKAKSDEIAKSEVILRAQNDAFLYTETLCHRSSFLEFDSVYLARQKAVLHAIEIYQPNKGPFRRLLRKRFFWVGKSKAKAAAVTYHNERNYIGRRIYGIRQASYFEENVGGKENLHDRMVRKLDIDQYRDKLKFPQQEIRNRYFLGLSFKEIAKIHNCSVSNISHIIYTNLERRKKLRKIK